MSEILTQPRKATIVRGLQMLVIGFLIHLAISIIGLLATIQFFWMLSANDRNAFITSLSERFITWTTPAIAFLLAKSDDKPFPWRDL